MDISAGGMSADTRLDRRSFRRKASVSGRRERWDRDRNLQWRIGTKLTISSQQCAVCADIERLGEIEKHGSRNINASDEQRNLQSHPGRTAALGGAQALAILSEENYFPGCLVLKFQY
jgi:hypothetical protein